MLDDGLQRPLLLPPPAPVLVVAPGSRPARAARPAGRAGLRSSSANSTLMTTLSFSRISPSWPSLTSSSNPVRCLDIVPGRPVAGHAGLAGQEQEEEAAQHERQREHAERGRDVGQVEEAAIRVDLAAAGGERCRGGLGLEPARLALEEEQPQHPDGQHRPEEEPDAEHVSRVDHRADQHLRQPQQEEHPVVAGPSWAGGT